MKTDQSFFHEGHNCWSVDEVTKNGVLVDGENYYKAFYEAAQKATRYIIIAGWQFDSGTRLLKKRDKKKSPFSGVFIHFLNQLCHKNPQLRVMILAWDFSFIYSFERESKQHARFNNSTAPNFKFVFDRFHPRLASHHQKFVVIDGNLAFTGGMDLCACRWDSRSHQVENPERTSPYHAMYAPYHEVQCFVTGPIVRRFVDIFVDRWQTATGEKLGLLTTGEPVTDFKGVLPLPPSRVALARTVGACVYPIRQKVDEIRKMFLDMIEKAERLIYIEVQYFASHEIYGALKKKLMIKSDESLQVIILLPAKLGPFKEQIAFGAQGTKMLRSLVKTAEANGHHVGVFNAVATDNNGHEQAVYIHSKVMIVDDKFMTIGSANLCNRSMGLDSELNLIWQAEDESMQQAIAEVRVSLLLEHTNLDAAEYRSRMVKHEGLAAFLIKAATEGICRLKFHNMKSIYEENPILNWIIPEDFSLDPAEAIIDAKLLEVAGKNPGGLTARFVRWLNRRIQRREAKLEDAPMSSAAEPEIQS